MRTFVTGGTGFIGRALLRALADDGPVTALYRPTSDREGLDLPNLRWAEGDLGSSEPALGRGGSGRSGQPEAGNPGMPASLSCRSVGPKLVPGSLRF